MIFYCILIELQPHCTSLVNLKTLYVSNRLRLAFYGKRQKIHLEIHTFNKLGLSFSKSSKFLIFDVFVQAKLDNALVSLCKLKY